MTAQPRPSVLFERYIHAGSALDALGAARELGKLNLTQALALVVCCRDAPEYERLAMRFHARATTELGVSSIFVSRLMHDGLALLPHEPLAGAQALQAVFARCDRPDLIDELRIIWQGPRPLRPK